MMTTTAIRSFFGVFGEPVDRLAEARSYVAYCQSCAWRDLSLLAVGQIGVEEAAESQAALEWAEAQLTALAGGNNG